MASAKDLKKRIGTVKNTQQTTRAMKMVSAAKLRRATDAINAQRPYAQRINTMIRMLGQMPEAALESPLIRSDEALPEGRKPRLMLLLVTSDRGLCGAFNANVIKAAQRFVAANSANYESIELSFLGRKGYDFFKNRKAFTKGTNFSELTGKVTFAKARRLADTLVARFLAGEVDEIKIIYNEFKNAVTQKTQIDDYLPLGRPTAEAGSTTATESQPIYLIKPSPREVLEELLAKNFAIQAFRVMLDSQAGEHGARMSAMENATKNAGEMIRKLTLEYNKQRQANITKELLEIIAGSESQKAS